MYSKVRSSSTLLFCFSSKFPLPCVSIKLCSSSSDIKPEISNSFVVDYLIRTCSLSETHAISAAKRLPCVNAQTADSVLCFLKKYGFSETQTRDAVRICPQILTSNVERNLKPKIKFFQELGITGTKLTDFISKNSTVLTFSLSKRLIPTVEALKITLNKSEHLIKALLGCKWLLYKDANSRLLPNVSYLQSCGIVDSQLSMLLTRSPILVVSSQGVLRNFVNKVEKMGISRDSRMFVHALQTLSSMKPEVLQHKFKLLRSFGFSEEETFQIFRKAPSLLRTSPKKLKLGMEFFVNTHEFEPSLMVRNPKYFMYSMEKRVVPRYKVVEALKSKMLMKKIPSFLNIIQMSESEFLGKFISRFEDHAEDLMQLYKGV